MKKMFYKHMVTEDTFKKLNFKQIEDDDKLYTVLGKLTHKEFNFALLNLGSLLKIADILEVDIKELLIREYKQYLFEKEAKTINPQFKVSRN